MTFTIDCVAHPLGRSARFKRMANVLIAILSVAMLHHSARAGAPLPATYSLTLAWNPSTSPEVVSYIAYRGTAPGNYTRSSNVGNLTTATISGLFFGITYYFAITAADVDGLESDFSNEFSYRLELPRVQLQSRGLVNGQFVLTVTGLAGNRYNLEATQDLATWTVIGTVTVGAGGSLDFTDTNAANYPQRYYRTRAAP